MKLAIMQPYLFPYIGYFQLMNAVDEFIVYDNIEFTKKGWINRNRILVNGQDQYITLPLKKGSDYLTVQERELADVWPEERKKLLNRIRESYRKAPFFSEVFSLIEQVVLFAEANLFQYILNSLSLTKEFLGLKTPLTIASAVSIDHHLKSEKKVVALCKATHATTYINPIGGLDLYDKAGFEKMGITLQFLKTKEITYPQFNHAFVPFLSIIDVLMFNPRDKVQDYLNYSYELL